MDRAEATDTDADFFAGSQGRSRQGAQDLTLDAKAHRARQIPLANQLVQEAVVSNSTGKFTTASDAQGLIDGLFKPVVGLFHIPILMSHPSIVPGRLHAVVGHERIVPLRPVFLSRLVQVTHRCAEMIGAVLLGYSAQLPQCFFDALGQSPRSVSLKQMLTASALEYVSTK